MGTVSSEQNSLKGIWISIESYEHKTSNSTVCMNNSKYSRGAREKIMTVVEWEECKVFWG